jgi:hypothetical protein
MHPCDRAPGIDDQDCRTLTDGHNFEYRYVQPHSRHLPDVGPSSKVELCGGWTAVHLLSVRLGNNDLHTRVFRNLEKLGRLACTGEAPLYLDGKQLKRWYDRICRQWTQLLDRVDIRLDDKAACIGDHSQASSRTLWNSSVFDPHRFDVQHLISRIERSCHRGSETQRQETWGSVSVRRLVGGTPACIGAFHSRRVAHRCCDIRKGQPSARQRQNHLQRYVSDCSPPRPLCRNRGYPSELAHNSTELERGPHRLHKVLRGKVDRTCALHMASARHRHLRNSNHFHSRYQRTVEWLTSSRRNKIE